MTTSEQQAVPVAQEDRDDIRRSIIGQLGFDPHADRIILPGTDWGIVLEALRTDATQTREAEGVEPDWVAIRAAVAKAAWPSTGLVDEAMATIRAALNARGGA